MKDGPENGTWTIKAASNEFRNESQARTLFRQPTIFGSIWEVL